MAGGIALTLARSLPMFVAGLWALTFGFFAAYDVASGRAVEQAASLYSFWYHVGSSVGGTLASRAWDDGARPAVVLLSGGLTVAAFVLALVLGGSYGPQPS